MQAVRRTIIVHSNEQYVDWQRNQTLVIRIDAEEYDCVMCAECDRVNARSLAVGLVRVPGSAHCRLGLYTDNESE